MNGKDTLILSKDKRNLGAADAAFRRGGGSGGGWRKMSTVWAHRGNSGYLDSLMKPRSCKAAVTQGLIASTCHSKSAALLLTIVVGEIKKKNAMYTWSVSQTRILVSAEFSQRRSLASCLTVNSW